MRCSLIGCHWLSLRGVKPVTFVAWEQRQMIVPDTLASSRLIMLPCGPLSQTQIDVIARVNKVLDPLP